MFLMTSVLWTREVVPSGSMREMVMYGSDLPNYTVAIVCYYLLYSVYNDDAYSIFLVQMVAAHNNMHSRLFVLYFLTTHKLNSL